MLRPLRSVRAAIVVIAALSSVLSPRPQDVCAADGRSRHAATMMDAAMGEGHAAHDVAGRESPSEGGCSHDEHDGNCQQHCAAQQLTVSVLPRRAAASPVVAVGRPIARPTTVILTAEPPPPRA